MGIRSDVTIALKKNVYDGLSAESKKTLSDWFEEPASKTKEGDVLFYIEDVKWYFDICDDLVALYNELEDKFDYDDFLIIQACHDYPRSIDGDLGGWIENPWETYRTWTVGVAWEEVNV